jgi:hypothetical protein
MDPADAAELPELLQFLSEWLARDPPPPRRLPGRLRPPPRLRAATTPQRRPAPLHLPARRQQRRNALRALRPITPHPDTQSALQDEPNHGHQRGHLPQTLIMVPALRCGQNSRTSAVTSRERIALGSSEPASRALGGPIANQNRLVVIVSEILCRKHDVVRQKAHMMPLWARTGGHADMKLPCRVEGPGRPPTTARVGLEARATGSSCEYGGKLVCSRSGSHTRIPQAEANASAHL